MTKECVVYFLAKPGAKRLAFLCDPHIALLLEGGGTPVLKDPYAPANHIWVIDLDTLDIGEHEEMVE